MDNLKGLPAEQVMGILELLLNRGFEAVVITDNDPNHHKILYVNDQFCNMTGYAKAELYGKSPKMLAGKRTSTRVTSRLKQALYESHPFVGATTNYKKDGTPYSVQWNIYPVMGTDGQPTHFLSIQKDLTELRQSLANLKSSSQSFRQFLNEIGESDTNNKDMIEVTKNATESLQSNAQVLSNYVNTTAVEDDNEDDDFFDFDIDDNDDTNIQAPTLSAEKLFKETTVDQTVISDIQDLAQSLSHLFELYDIQDLDESSRVEFIEELQDLSNSIFFVEEFIDISIALSELSVCMMHYKEHSIDFLLAEALKGLTTDLSNWVKGVFVDQSASDVHWLDNSIIGSAKQVLVFLRMQHD